jgi:hypothetical protein
MIVDTDQLHEVAWQGASAAGQLIQESWQKPKSIEYKGAIDLVTSVDRESERIIIAAIQHYFPDHSIVGEEETIVHGADQECRWIVDPLDGTTNFAHAYFPIESPVRVRAADRIAIRLDNHDGIAVRWQADVRRGAESIARFDHSTLQAMGLSIETLRKQSDDYRPLLTPLGALERDLLDRFDGTRSAAELESWLASRAGSALPSSREAAAFLKQTIERCG